MGHLTWEYGDRGASIAVLRLTTRARARFVQDRSHAEAALALVMVGQLLVQLYACFAAVSALSTGSRVPPLPAAATAAVVAAGCCGPAIDARAWGVGCSGRPMHNSDRCCTGGQPP